METLSRRVLSALAILGSLTLLSCGGGDGNGGTDPDPDDAIASVSVTPNSATLDVGDTQQLQATVRNGRNEVVSAAVSWTSGDDSRATVSTGGLVSAVGEGPVTITASAGGKNGTAAVTVNDPSPPQSPGGLQVTAVSDTEMRLDWTDNATNEDEYRVEREELGGPLAVSGPQTVYEPVTTLGPNSTTYTDTGLDPDVLYRYRVRACNDNGCSDFSGEAEGTTLETLVIETVDLPAGAKDVPYSQTLMASGGDGPPTWDVATGALPTGLAMNAAGEITGTPTVAGTFEFTVRATGAGQTPTRELSITITEEIQAPEVTTTSLPDGGVGAPYAAQLQAAMGDGDYAWDLIGGTLPGGVMLGAGGAISGTPVAEGTFAFTVEVTSAAMSGEADLEITVHPALAVATDELPDGVEGEMYAVPLAAAGGDGAATWSIEAGSLPPGLTLAANGMITGMPAAGTSTFTVAVESGVGQTASRELSITIYALLEIGTTSLPDGELGAAYSETLAATGGDGTNSWSITTGALPDGLTLNPATGEISGTPTEVGSFDITVRVQSGDGQTSTADLSLEIDPAPVEITTTSLPGGTLNVAYSQQLQATGGDGSTYTWTLVGGGLPTGLAMSGGGAITGTPTAAGTFDFTVGASSGGETDEQELSITITEVIEAPEVTTISLPDGGVGAPYAAQLQAAQGDGNYAWAVTGGALPAGVVLAADGTLSGTPTADGTFTVTFEVTSAAMTDDAELDITIHPELTVASDALPDGVEGEAYETQLVAEGGDGTEVWSLESGDLPSGLALAANGSISGTPEAAGTSTFTVGVESGVGQMATKELSITINEPLAISTSTLPDGQVDVAYSETLAASGGDGTNTWSLTGGDLPDGLSLNTDTGEISGTATAAGSFNFTVQVQSGDGQADAANLNIEIDPAAVVITTTSLPGGTANVAYSQQLAATGGDGSNYTWSVAGGDLPTGLSLGAGGGISGTPTADGTFNFTVEVSSAGQTDDQALSIVIAAGSVDPVVIELSYLVGGYVGVPYSDVLAPASGGNGTFQYSVTDGVLPDGLSLDANTGEISGTPAAAGMAFFEVTAESGGESASVVLGLTISTTGPGDFNMWGVNVADAIPSVAVRTQLNSALARWEGMVTGDAPGGTLPSGLTTSDCDGSGPLLNGAEIDDVVVLINIGPIDEGGSGGSNTLGYAGPCGYIRNSQPRTLSGFLRLDEFDLAALSTSDLFGLIWHEIGHVMGIGSLWSDSGVITDAGSGDPRFTGAMALGEFSSLGGGGTIPVEGEFGPGTADSHWDEAFFDNELMTGFINNGSNPISRMTIASLADIGWTVSYLMADSYSIPGCSPTCVSPSPGAGEVQYTDIVVHEPLIPVTLGGSGTWVPTRR